MEVGILNIEQGYAYIYLFDADGAVAKESADEWDQIDIADLLHTEIGLPEPESRAIAEKFLAAANFEEREQSGRVTPIPDILLLGGIVGGVLVVIGVGLWTIASWIF